MSKNISHNIFSHPFDNNYNFKEYVQKHELTMNVQIYFEQSHTLLELK